MKEPRIEPPTSDTGDLLYISEKQVTDLALSADQCCGAIKSIFSAHAAQQTFALAATHLDISPGRGFRSLCAAWPDRNLAGNKWFGVRPPIVGQPGEGIQALYMLNNYTTGAPLAVISANQMTGLRTASMSTVVLQKLLPDQASTIGFIGCGLQASFHLHMISSLFPKLTNVRCYSRSLRSAQTISAQAAALGITAQVCECASDVVTKSQIVVSSIPLSDELVAFLNPLDIQRGGILLAVDLARPWHTEQLNSFELKITDDHEQQAALPLISSTLGPLGSFDADLADVVTNRVKPFDPLSDRAVFAFRGFSLADLAIASLIYEQALLQSRGQHLDRFS